MDEAHIDVAALFERHHRQIWRFIARLAGRDCADELTGEVFVRACARQHQFDPTRGSVESWLYGIAANLVRDHWRRRGRAARALARLGAAPAAEASGTDRVDDVEDSRTEIVRVRNAVAALPEPQREVLVLHAWEGLPYEEIAVALGVEVGTVRSRLARARTRLRELTERSGVVPAGDPMKETSDG